MKRVLFVVLSLSTFGANAMASDFSYTETETITTYEEITITVPLNTECGVRYNSCHHVRPCEKKVPAEPVRVKTHTEVIDHYQVYQPVTVYKPMGTQIERRVLSEKNCNKCGM
ncbi:MAG: hypothetical protein IKW67_00765 [Alphaproteobacteria bacterium]|nr:hypothetical protein [Alphaproteobacteria bacterium]